MENMVTWEILVGLAGILTPFLSVMSVVVKVNRSLVSLENAVKQMTLTLEKQHKKNGSFALQLSDHEKRLLLLETRLEQKDYKAPKKEVSE